MKNLKYAAKLTGRAMESLAVDAITAAFANYESERKAGEANNTIKALNAASDSETVAALKARIKAAEESA